LAPQITRSGRTGFYIAHTLADCVDERELGEVFTEVPFVLVDGPNWVKGSRTPDVMFYSQAQLDVITQDRE
jgi:Uma2 family endonuclease